MLGSLYSPYPAYPRKNPPEMRYHMGTGFRKFKRKMLIGALVRAGLFGLSLAAITVAGLWLAAKLTLGEVNFLLFAAIGAAPAALSIAIWLLVLWPTDRRVARRLDRDLALGEKAQTMIDFQNDPSDMAALQRENAREILAATPRRRARGVLTWLFVALPLVATLAVVGTILVPAKEPPAPVEPPPVVETGWRFDDFRKQKLDDLIKYVSESDMEEEARDAVVGELDGLRIKLGSVRKESVMQEMVIDAIVHIHTIVSDHNTYDLITAAMANTVSAPVKQLGNSMNSLKPLLISEQIKSMKETVLGVTEDESSDETETDTARTARTPRAGETTGRAETATLIATALEQAVERSGVPATNRVNAALAAIAADLKTVTDDTSDADIEIIFKNAESNLLLALEPETINEAVEAYTINRLMEIFGIPADRIPPEVLKKASEATTEGNYRPDDEPEHNNAGGLGSGEVLYGSNDTVYDPDQGKYVAYGELLTRYNSIVLEYLTGDSEIPEELREMLFDYFTMLSNGAGQKDD